jgi:hypothetical protein
VGEVVIQRGLLKIRRLAEERVFQERGLVIPVFESDVIHTGRETRVVFTLFETRESVTIYADTHVRVAELRRERGNFVLDTGKALFSLLRELATEREMTVQTRTVTVGVKGTEFIVGAREEESFALTLDGTIAVTPSAAPEREIRVEPGQMYFVTPETVPPQPVAVSPQAQQRIRTEDGLGGLRDAAGLTPVEPRREPSLFLRTGVATHYVTMPYRDSGRRTVTLAGGGLLLSVEYRAWGPLIMEAMAFQGGLDHITGAGASVRDEGDTTTAALSAGLRQDFGGALSASLAAGPFRHWSRVERAPMPESGSGETTVNLEGGLARVTLDYVLETGIAFTLAGYYGRGSASGTGPDRLRAQGSRLDAATLSAVALTVGARF